MHKIWAVIRREFVERVRTRAFIISTLLGPVFFAVLVILPGYMLSRDTGPKVVAVIDATTTDFGQKVSGAMEAARRGRGASASARYILTRVPATGRETEVRDSLVALTGIS